MGNFFPVRIGMICGAAIPIRTTKIPIQRSRDTSSCRTNTEATTAAGNSAAPRIVPRPEPSFGTPIEKKSTGITIPSNPKGRPYFQSPSVSAPS